MNKKFRVLLSAFLSVAVATSSLPVTAAAEGLGASWSTNELADNWSGDSSIETEEYNYSSDDVSATTDEVAETSEETADVQPVASETTTASVSAEDARLISEVESRKNASAAEISALKDKIQSGQAKGTCTDGLSWNIDSNLTLTISGTGAMTDSTLPWQAYAPVVTKIVISDTVTAISTEAFLGFVAATDVTIGKGVKVINDRAFYGCVKLASLAMNATALTTIASGAFYDCTPLANLTIPSTVTTIGDDAFSGCKKITQVTIPAGVATLGKGAFYGCEALKTVTISDGVKVIDERAFAACIALDTLKLPSGLTAINK